MNSLLTLLGIESWKPILTALVMPPVPFLLLVLVGARLILPRRGLGWFVIVLSVTGLWLSACAGTGEFLMKHLLRPPAALNAEAIAELRAAAKAKQPVAILVLGGGAEQLAPEYGVANLADASLERLRYGLWLSKETGLPVGFSGGVGWAQTPGAHAEAAIAARIAQQEFGRPLRWVEDRSRDTRENAQRSLGLLTQDGITQVVLVTHHWHMPRARKVFEETAAGSVSIRPAPMGLGAMSSAQRVDWLPTAGGFEAVRHALKEWLGRAAGA